MQAALDVNVVDETAYEETKNSETEDRISSLCTVESVQQQEQQKLSSLAHEMKGEKHDKNINLNQRIEMIGKAEIVASRRQQEQQVDHLSMKMNDSVNLGKSQRQSKQANYSQGMHAGTRISLESEGKEPETLFEKKRARFRVVKDWEDKRIQKTSIFASIFNEIGDNLTKIATQSNDFIENVLFFFKDTQIQLAQLAKAAPASQIEEAFKYSPHIGNISYPAIHRVLRSVAEVDQTATQNASDFSKFIDQSIMRNYIISDKKNFTSVFSAFTILLKDKKAKIAKLEKIAVGGYEQYSELFKQMMLLQTKGKETRKDFYYQELMYMHHVNEHLENLRDFGLQIVRFTEELEQLQRKRLQSVHKALELYLTKRKELMESLECDEIAQEMLNSMEMGLDKTKLEMATLLLPEQVNYIRQCYRCEELNISNLKQFAQDFALRSVSEKTLVLKELSAQQPLEGKTNNDFTDCSLIFTIDKYLIIAAGMLDSFGKPQALIYLPNSKVSFSKDTLILTLTEIHHHACWNSKKSYFFKLEHEFDAKEITSLLTYELPQQL